MTVLILSVPIVLVVLLFVALLRPDTTRLELTDTRLIVRFSGGDRFMTLHSRIRIPRSRIAGVTLGEVELLPQGYGLVGVAAAGVRAGSFVGSKATSVKTTRDFWMVRRARTVLVIEMKPGSRMRRYVLEVPDPQQALASVSELLAQDA